MVCISMINTFSVAAEETEDDKSESTEIINVVGIRGSLERAIEIKRSAGNIVEAISAEDIGALPDISIAESLERMTGLAADRDRGNSSQISIRGLGPNLGLATVNNREVTSASPSRNVKFEQFPSELLTSAEVYKSPMASLIEGGVSGTINMNTIKPLSKNERIVVVNVKGAYSEIDADLNDSNGTGYRVSGAYIDQFLDEKLGIAIGFAKRDMPSSTQRYINYGYNDNKDWNGDGVNDFAPGGISGRITDGNDSRDGFFTSIQWRPTTSVDINYDFLSTQSTARDDRSFFAFGGISNANPANATGIVVDENNTLLAASNVGTKGNDTLIQDLLVVSEDSTTLHGLNFNWAFDDWELNADIAHSKTERDQLISLAKLRSRTNPTVNFDNSNGQYSANSNVDITNAANFWPWQAEINNINIDDELTSYKFDATKYVDSSFISKVSFGVRYSQRAKEYNRDLDKPTVFGGQGKAYDLTTTPEFVQEFAYSDTFSFINGDLPQSWLNVDRQGYLDTYWTTPDDPKLETEGDRLASWDVEEDTVAAYVQIDFEGELGTIPYTGNLGARYVKTDIRSLGSRADFAVIENPSDDEDPIVFDPATLVNFVAEHDYSEVLPTLNVNFELSDDLFLRTAVAKTIARAPLDNMAASQSINYNSDENIIVGLGGNPALNPFKAEQFDVSLEWYFAEASLLTVAYFYKNVDSFIVNSVVNDSIAGISTEISAPTNNEEGGTIKGYELSYQQPFTFLPEMFHDFGINANYTSIDNSAETEIFSGSELNTNLHLGLEGVSDEISNVSFYYDNSVFSARLAYRYRSAFTRDVGGVRVNDQSEYLDLNFRYNLSEQLNFTLSIANLTDENLTLLHVPSTADAVYSERPNYIENSGRRVFIGMRYKF
jgi:iron complex outermembrane receptor protein